MKRVIAILVVFALVAGAAFAEINFGGALGFGVNFVEGDSETTKTPGSPDIKDVSEIGSTMWYKGAKVDLDFSGDNFGGRARVFAGDADGSTGSAWWHNTVPLAFVWWKPFEQFKVWLGHNPEGELGTAKISGWGYLTEAQDYVAIGNDSDGATYGSIWKLSNGKAGFYPGFGGEGAILSIYPIEMIDVNIVLPFDVTSGYTYDVFRKMHVNAILKIENIGNATLSWEGKSTGPAGLYQSVGSIYASFNLTAVENLNVDIGVGLDLPYKNTLDKDVDQPFTLGLGATYAAGDFGIKFKFGAKFLKDSDTDMGVGLLPYYNFGAFTGYLNLGLGLSIPDGGGDGDIDWFVNPYIKVPAGGPTFFVGLKLGGSRTYSGVQTIDNVHWAVPVGIHVYF